MTRPRRPRVDPALVAAMSPPLRYGWDRGYWTVTRPEVTR